MDSLSKFIAKVVTITGAIAGSCFAWIAQASAVGSGASLGWQVMTILAFGSAAAGGLGWFATHRRLRQEHLQRRERCLIAAAKQQQGRVTDVELVASTPYSLEECRAFLKEMTESGSAEMHVGKEGTMVYLFPGFLSEVEKRNAQSAGEWRPEPRQAQPSDRPPPMESTRSLEME